MSDYISYLFRHRLKAKLFSFLWLKIWLKRLINFRGLIKVIFRAYILSLKGAEIGRLSVIGKLELNGKANNLSIGDECVIGNKVHLALHDEIHLGNNVVISDGCILLTGSHDINHPDWPLITAAINIEDYVWIATNATIMPGVTIGYGAVIAAGSVVTKNVPAYHVVAGNPARKIKERSLKKISHKTVRYLAPIEAWTGLYDD